MLLGRVDGRGGRGAAWSSSVVALLLRWLLGAGVVGVARARRRRRRRGRALALLRVLRLLLHLLPRGRHLPVSNHSGSGPRARTPRASGAAGVVVVCRDDRRLVSAPPCARGSRVSGRRGGSMVRVRAGGWAGQQRVVCCRLVSEESGGGRRQRPLSPRCADASASGASGERAGGREALPLLLFLLLRLLSPRSHRHANSRARHPDAPSTHIYAPSATRQPQRAQCFRPPL